MTYFIIFIYYNCLSTILCVMMRYREIIEINNVIPKYVSHNNWIFDNIQEFFRKIYKNCPKLILTDEEKLAFKITYVIASNIIWWCSIIGWLLHFRQSWICIPIGLAIICSARTTRKFYWKIIKYILKYLQIFINNLPSILWKWIKGIGAILLILWAIVLWLLLQWWPLYLILKALKK